MRRLSQFPTPYPDECYYSILCRYYQRMGYTSFDKTMKSLFGGIHHAELFILMPYLASYVNYWVEPDSGIDAESITYNNTAFSYCTLGDWNWWYRPLEVKYSMWNGTIRQYTGFRDVKKGNLCYCAVCASEERQKYGEPYWHRLHQIKGVTICPKHSTELYSSGVTFQDTKKRYYPASSILPKEEKMVFSMDSLSARRIQIASDIAWILDHGKTMCENTYFRDLMKNYLLKKGYELERVKSGDTNAMLDLRGFEEFYIDKQNGYIFNGAVYVRNAMTNPYFPVWGFSYFKPFDIIMLIEYLEGSAEKFYSYFDII